MIHRSDSAPPTALSLAGGAAPLTWTRAGAGAPVLVLAHGSGMAMDDPRMEQVAQGLGARGVGVVRFEFPYMRSRRVEGRGPANARPDDDATLIRSYAAVVEELQGGERYLAVGGWSLGGRIAARTAGAGGPGGAAALVCLSYPFHPIGSPKEQGAVEALRGLEVPALVVQGTRDAFGNREQVRGYGLPPSVGLRWLEDANHALVPRVRSGLQATALLDGAIEAIAAFVLRSARARI